MPFMEVTGKSVAEDDALPGLELFNLHLEGVEMRLAVRSGVDSSDFHSSALMKNSAVKYKIDNLAVSLRFKPVPRWRWLMPR
jgi:hypothetical protein